MKLKSLFPNGSTLIEKRLIGLNQLWVTREMTREEGMSYRDALRIYFDPELGKRVFMGLDEGDKEIDLYRLCIEWPTEKTPGSPYLTMLTMFTRGFFAGKGWD